MAIAQTRNFFENVGFKTRLSDYTIGADQIPVILKSLKAHGMTALLETGDLTPDIAKLILKKSL